MILLKRLLNLGFLAFACMIPIFSIFLIANIGIRFLVLSILIVIFSLIIPGTFLIKYTNFKSVNFLESVVIGTTFASSIALLVHPILGLFGIARYTYIVFIVIGFIYLGFNISKFSIRFVKDNFRIPALVSFILIPYGLWIGRQANVVPINNFDKYSVPPDIYHHMSIAAEIGNHGPAIYPYIAGSGVALQYHWGAFSLGSFLSAGGLIPLAVAMYRLLSLPLTTAMFAIYPLPET